MAPSRPVQHEIDKRARGILDEALASWASTNLHAEDYGIDYSAEVFSRSNSREMKTALGLDFQIQLKGTRSPRIVDNSFAFSFETKLLLHFLTNKRIPVFLVVIDVERREGAFVFLQQIALELAPGWQDQETVTIRLPIRNSIHDASCFERAVREADKQMTTLRPGSVRAAVNSEIAKIKLQNPQVQHVSVTATEEATTFAIHLKPDAAGQLTFHGQEPQINEFFHHAVEKGELVAPSDYQVTVSTSGITLGSAAESSIKQLQLCRKAPGSLRISGWRDGRELGSIELWGEWVAGTKFGTLTAALPNRLMSATVSMADKVDDRGVKVDFSFSFDLSDWVDKDIGVGLAYFDQLNRLFAPLDETDSLRFETLIQGNFVGAVLTPLREMEWARIAHANLTAISKARYISLRTGTRLKLSVPLNAKLVDEIDFAHRLLTGERVPLSVTRSTCTTSGGEREFKLGDTELVDITLRQSSHTCEVLSEQVDCGPSDVHFEQATLRAVDVRTVDGLQHVTWEITPNKEVYAVLATALSQGGDGKCEASERGA